MLSLSFMWVMAGLMVLYHLDVREIIGFLQMESDLSEESSEADNRASFVISLFLTVLMWPLVLLEYQKSR